jgi:hypothetical protein
MELPNLATIWANATKNAKARMSFTDLIPSLSAGGVTTGFVNQAQAIANFLNPVGTDFLSQNFWQQSQDVLESIDFAINMIINPVISLWINPQSITVSKNILLNKQITKGGFVVQFWGHDLETISVKAETGYFGLSKIPLNAFELFKNYCYQGRYHPTRPLKSLPITTMLYENQALRGYFNNFNYNIVQSRPYIIQYDFTFTVVELVTIPIVATVASIYTQFNPQNYDSAQSDAMDALSFGKGWGTKLY